MWDEDQYRHTPNKATTAKQLHAGTHRPVLSLVSCRALVPHRTEDGGDMNSYDPHDHFDFKSAGTCHLFLPLLRRMNPVKA
jgi:hypothetical protein